MSDNWTTDVRPGYRTKTLQYGNCTIIVHRPILSEDEAAKRERAVVETLQAVMPSYIRRKAATA